MGYSWAIGVPREQRPPPADSPSPSRAQLFPRPRSALCRRRRAPSLLYGRYVCERLWTQTRTHGLTNTWQARARDYRRAPAAVLVCMVDTSADACGRRHEHTARRNSGPYDLLSRCVNNTENARDRRLTNEIKQHLSYSERNPGPPVSKLRTRCPAFTRSHDQGRVSKRQH